MDKSAGEQMTLFSTVPTSQGLYNPENEHDACGVAMVATPVSYTHLTLPTNREV